MHCRRVDPFTLKSITTGVKNHNTVKWLKKRHADTANQKYLLKRHDFARVESSHHLYDQLANLTTTPFTQGGSQTDRVPKPQYLQQTKNELTTGDIYNILKEHAHVERRQLENYLKVKTTQGSSGIELQTSVLSQASPVRADGEVLEKDLFARYVSSQTRSERFRSLLKKKKRSQTENGSTIAKMAATNNSIITQPPEEPIAFNFGRLLKQIHYKQRRQQLQHTFGRIRYNMSVQSSKKYELLLDMVKLKDPIWQSTFQELQELKEQHSARQGSKSFDDTVQQQIVQRNQDTQFLIDKGGNKRVLAAAATVNRTSTSVRIAEDGESDCSELEVPVHDNIELLVQRARYNALKQLKNKIKERVQENVVLPGVQKSQKYSGSQTARDHTEVAPSKRTVNVITANPIQNDQQKGALSARDGEIKNTQILWSQEKSTTAGDDFKGEYCATVDGVSHAVYSGRQSTQQVDSVDTCVPLYLLTPAEARKRAKQQQTAKSYAQKYVRERARTNFMPPLPQAIPNIIKTEKRYQAEATDERRHRRMRTEYKILA